MGKHILPNHEIQINQILSHISGHTLNNFLKIAILCIQKITKEKAGKSHPPVISFPTSIKAGLF